MDTITDVYKFFLNGESCFFQFESVLGFRKNLKSWTGNLKIDIFFSLEAQDFHIGFSKKKPHQKQLVQDFNQGLEIIKKNGAHDKIIKLYGLGNE